MGKKYDVLKVLVKRESNNKSNASGAVYLALDNRVYFIDRMENSDLMDTIAFNTMLYSWITKKFDKTGRARFTIDGVFINDYIKKIPTFTAEDYSATLHDMDTQTMRFFSYLWYNDIEFGKYRDSDFKYLKNLRSISDFIDCYADSKEKSLLKMKLLVDNYLAQLPYLPVEE